MNGVLEPHAVKAVAGTQRRQRAPSSLVAAIYTFGAAVGVLMVGLQGRLPGNFGDDDLRIRQIALGEMQSPNASFNFIGGVYRTLGLAEHATLAGLFSYGCFVGVLVAVTHTRVRDAASVLPHLLVCGALVIGGVFMGQYTKEVVVLIPVLTIGVTRGNGLKSELLALSSIAVVAAVMRTYWWLVLVAYLALLGAQRCRMPLRRQLFGVAAGYFALAIYFYYWLGESLDFQRIKTNRTEVRQATTNTALRPFFDLGNEVVGGVVNTIGALFALMFPWPLLRTGAVYAVVALCIAALWWSTLTAYRRYLKERRRNETIVRSFALIFAFVVVQAMFEPDYGSYARHISPLLPIFASVLLEYQSFNPLEEPGAR